MLTVSASIQTYRTHKPFRIARGEKNEAVQVIATLHDGTHQGRGACVPYERYGESVDSVIQAIEQARPVIESSPEAINHIDQHLSGAALNAIDCAMLDLSARVYGKPVWQLLTIPEPMPKPSAITISVNSPNDMGQEAKNYADYALIKVKLAGERADSDRVKAVHTNAPNAKLILDANESMTRASLDLLSTSLPWDNIALIEQPLPAGQDEQLAGYAWRDYLCADESAHSARDIAKLLPFYGAVNIKLDKTGGITNAHATIQKARNAGLKIMIGCMLGSSLAMAPAFMLSGLADYLDLDGPLLLRDDDRHGFAFQNGVMQPSRMWGYV